VKVSSTMEVEFEGRLTRLQKVPVALYPTGHGEDQSTEETRAA
jgi:hypothetical protein